VIIIIVVVAAAVVAVIAVVVLSTTIQTLPSQCNLMVFMSGPTVSHHIDRVPSLNYPMENSV
jgi:hypothetical protein